MDTLEDMMNNNSHLVDEEAVKEQISSVSKFWSVLSDEDKDYIQGAQWAIEEKAKWNDD